MRILIIAIKDRVINYEEAKSLDNIRVELYDLKARRYIELIGLATL